MSISRSLWGLVFSCRIRRPSKALAILFLALAVLLSRPAAFSREPDRNWTEKTLRHLTLRDKIAQLIQIRVPGKFINRQSPDFQALKDQIRENHVGGVVLFAGNVYESAHLLNELQAFSKIPLIVSADFERGLSFRISETTSFPWTMAIGATGSEKYSFDQGLITGREARALGVHWIFAPVVDVNNNPDNPVINIRSYGEDPAVVARLGAAFIRGASKAGVLATAKHFPGHGDTAVDSHLGLAVIDSNMNRLQKVELEPFRSAIQAGVDSIMTAHVAVPEITGRPDVPATLSPKILTDLLRNTLKFGGIIVTDALEMGGITNTYWSGLAAVRALEAGADALLLPTDPGVAINEVERAVRRGSLSEARIDESVRRILRAKLRMGLNVKRTVALHRIADIVASPESVKLAQEIADRSITVVRDEQHLLPVNPLGETRIFSLVLASDLESSPGAAFQAEMRKHFVSLRTAWANARIPDDLQKSIDRMAAESDLIVCATLSRLSSGQNTIALPQNQQILLKRLIALRKPMIWVSFGNPYVVRLAPETPSYMCTFSYSDVSQVSAAKAIAGEIPVSGKMPVSIPGFSGLGEGIEIAALPMTLKTAATSKPFNNSLQDLLDSYVKRGVFKQAALLAGRNNSVVLDISSGKQGLSSLNSDAAAEAIYGLDSLSKPVRAGSAAMLAVDSGILLPGALVRDYLPEFEKQGELRVSELLSRLSENQASSGQAEKMIEEMTVRASGVPTGSFLKAQLYDPLGIHCLMQNRSQSDPKGFSCSAMDLAVFSQMLLNRGMYGHRTYFKPETVARYTGPQGIWHKSSHADWTRKLFSSAAFGHTSSTGPLLWIDPGKQLFIILLTRNADPDRIEEAQISIVESVMTEIANNE